MTTARSRGGITRRGALQALLVGGAGLSLARLAPLPAWAGPPRGTTRAAGRAAGSAAGAGRAKAVIEIWLGGGPSHVDTFDPKPAAGYDYCGPLAKAIPTNVDGVRIGQSLPLLAQQADKFALVRSMSHGINGHETATYVTQTGRQAGGERLVYPGLGAIVAALRGYGHGYEGLIPPYVVLTSPLGRFNPTGFLGSRFSPFVTGGDPNQRRFAVEGIVAEGISDERQQSRRALLESLDTLGSALPAEPVFETFDRCGEKAYDLILGASGKLFDLSVEKPALRDRYGRNRFGQSCLMARRLVEHGVPYVTVHSRGWDTHKQHFQSMRRMLPELDRGLAALLQDLAERDLLDRTVVWCCGEFGRTPRVQWEPPWNGGRSHFGACFSALVAGGGFQGGRVLGTSNDTGEKVAERPVHPIELLGAVCERMGIDPDGPLPNPRGLDVRVMPAADGAPAQPRLGELL